MRWSKTGHSQTMCFAKISKRSLYSVVRRRNGGKNDGIENGESSPETGGYTWTHAECMRPEKIFRAR